MSHKILLVDDEPDVLFYLQAALEDHGYEVCTLEGGEPFEKTVRREGPDLVCLDVMMPKRSGISLLKRLLTTEDLKHIPAIVITGMLRAQDVIESELGSLVDGLPPERRVGVLEKPVSIDELVGLIQGYLGK